MSTREMCEMCEMRPLGRYVHVMRHRDYPQQLRCCAPCAAEMSGIDPAEIRRREREMATDGKRHHALANMMMAAAAECQPPDTHAVLLLAWPDDSLTVRVGAGLGPDDLKTYLEVALQGLTQGNRSDPTGPDNLH